MDELHAINTRAREIIKEGLDLDENTQSRAKNRAKIRDFYLKGAQELERGLNMNIDPSTTDQDKRTIQKVRDTMKRSLSMVLDRLENMKISNDVTPPPSSKPCKAVPPTVQVTRIESETTIAIQRPCRLGNHQSSAINTKNTNGLQRLPRYATLPGPGRRQSAPNNGHPPTRVAGLPVRSDSFKLPSNRPGSSGLQQPRLANRSKVISPISERIINVPGVEQKLVRQISDEILESKEKVFFKDIAGQETAKETLKEMLVWPRKNPDLFKALRTPPKGLLLFGPPGNGKTLLAKAVACETDGTFFNVSASTLTSKWVGEGEKLVKALFEIARHLSPSVIFIDEIDSILKQRSDSEHEASRRLKTELFVQMDGMKSTHDDGVVVIAATNRPQELDNAGLRRFPKRIFVGLPDFKARMAIIKSLMSKQNNLMSLAEYERIANLTEGFSACDLTNLAKDAAFGPIRELDATEVEKASPSDIRLIEVRDFVHSLKKVRGSVSSDTIRELLRWNETYGDITV